METTTNVVMTTNAAPATNTATGTDDGGMSTYYEESARQCCLNPSCGCCTCRCCGLCMLICWIIFGIWGAFNGFVAMDTIDEYAVCPENSISDGQCCTYYDGNNDIYLDGACDSVRTGFLISIADNIC